LLKITIKKEAPSLAISHDQLSRLADLIDDKKGRNISILDLRGISIITDYFIIATGNTTIQTKAIVDHLIEKLPEIGIAILRIEGLPEAEWILIDCGDLVIHIMTPDTREFYSLEKLWGDAKRVVL